MRAGWMWGNLIPPPFSSLGDCLLRQYSTAGWPELGPGSDWVGCTGGVGGGGP